MQLAHSDAVRRMERDPGRWLYILLHLAHPLRQKGVTVYAPDTEDLAEECAVVTDFAEGVTVRFYGRSTGLLDEALSDPAVRMGARLCFCGGVPVGFSGKLTAGGHRFRADPTGRSLDRFGLYAFQEDHRRASPPDGWRMREAAAADFEELTALERSDWGSFPDEIGEFGDHDRLWLACAADGAYGGYLWATEAGRAYYDIVNVFVRRDLRGIGLGKALVSRYAAEAMLRGRRAYYGYAVTRESACLARSLGFREIYPETVSYFAVT
ncbi:MAG: GNAT family N-acetyltransferase [Clostridia bacterium]|nr:GNAT family N-acetyltransferase [Clostridia bacterium]